MQANIRKSTPCVKEVYYCISCVNHSLQFISLTIIRNQNIKVTDIRSCIKNINKSQANPPDGSH